MTAKIYGHRGARGERAENTMEAFRHAQSLGLAGIETDIALTADFVPVLHHDPGLSDGRLIKNLAASELPAQIPSLAQALAVAPEMEWLLEVKTFPACPDDTHSPALMAEHILHVLADAPAKSIRILAFDWSVLRAFAARAPDLPRICLTAPDMEAARAIWWGPGYEDLDTPGAVAKSGAQGWAAFQGTLTDAGIAQARAKNLEIFAWTVNTAPDFARLAPLVDGVITDFPTRFIAPG